MKKILLAGLILVIAVGIFTTSISKAFAADTGWKAPSLSDESGFTNPNNAFLSDGSYATASSSMSQKYANFDISTIPTGSIIDGIEVRVEAHRQSNNSHPRKYSVSLSGDGGSSFTSAKNTTDFGDDSDSTKTVGDTNDDWGRTWTTSEFSNANFRVRLTSEDDGDKTIYLDYIEAKVYYTPPATITSATGGDSISADAVGGAYTSLTGPIVTESKTGQIKAGTIILNAPMGFLFDSGSPTVNVLVTRIGGSGSDNRNINNLSSGSSISATVSPDGTTAAITITGITSNGVTNRLTWRNIRVRPTSGTPLASGDITKTGTSSYTSDTTNYGTLTEVYGTLSSVAISPATSTITTDETRTFTVEGLDQYGNSRGDITSETSLTITPEAGGSLAGNVYTPSKTGSWTVTGINGAVTGTASLIVNPGAVSASRATLSADPLSVSTDGGASTITVVLKDDMDNVIPGKIVTFSATGSNNAFGSDSVVTDASGIASTTLSSTKAETKTVSATADDVIISQTANIEFAVGALSSIEISPVGPQDVVSSSTLQFSAQGYDANYNSKSGLIFSWGIDSQGGTGTISDGGLFTADRAGQLTVMATTTDSEITGQSGTITVYPSAATNATISADINPQQAGKAVALTVTVKDAQGNLVEDETSVDLIASLGELSGDEVTTNGIALLSLTYDAVGDSELTMDNEWQLSGDTIISFTDDIFPSVTVNDIADFVDSLAGISGTASDDESGLDLPARLKIEDLSEETSTYYNGSSGWTSEETWLPVSLDGTSWTFDSSAATFTSGHSYEVSVEAKDKAGNASYANDAFTFDNDAPTGEVISPTTGSLVRSTITVQVRADDGINGSGVRGVQFYYASVGMPIGDEVTTGEGDIYSVDWNTVGVSEGTHHLFAVVYDNLGHSFQTDRVAVQVSVDNQSPQITSIEATDSTTVKVTFGEELQNNPEGHHPSVTDFRVYNGEEYAEENDYGIGNVGYSSSTDSMVTITLNKPIQSGDNPHLDIVDLRPTTIVDLAGNEFDYGSEYDHKVYDEINPIAQITPDIALGNVGQEINFSGANSSDLFAGIHSYQWDFGDGSEAPTPTDSPAISHSYESAGVYDVTLTVYDTAKNHASFTSKAIINSEEDKPTFDSGDGLKIKFNSLPDGSYDLNTSKKTEPAGGTTGFSVAGVYYEITSSLTNGEFSADLTLSYPDADDNGIVDGTSINENELDIYYWNGSAWVAVAGPVRDGENNTITVTVDHFTQFGLLQQSQQTSTNSPALGGGIGQNIYSSTPAPAAAPSAPTAGSTIGGGSVLGAARYYFDKDLRFGMKGDAVTELQKRLKEEGFYNGDITGYFGAATLNAVKAYQAKNNLPRTGFVGPMTRARLNGSVVAGVSTDNSAEAIRNQITQLQGQLLILLQALLHSLR